MYTRSHPVPRLSWVFLTLQPFFFHNFSISYLQHAKKMCPVDPAGPFYFGNFKVILQIIYRNNNEEIVKNCLFKILIKILKEQNPASSKFWHTNINIKDEIILSYILLAKQNGPGSWHKTLRDDILPV